MNLHFFLTPNIAYRHILSRWQAGGGIRAARILDRYEGKDIDAYAQTHALQCAPQIFKQSKFGTVETTAWTEI